ncbi:hypothetical protein ACU635_37480 [[Actinomadura] parvosata]|uniref:hypothetical protein n=1 Tax=[Actinomadura] parvosata TaxID=1955412 RepID=UPI00406CD86C
MADGCPDIAIGRASRAPAAVTSKLIRLDPPGVLVPEGHRFAALVGVPVADPRRRAAVLGEESRTPELNQLAPVLCRSAGFTPALYESSRAAADLVLQHRCVSCSPPPTGPAPPGGPSPIPRRTTPGPCCGTGTTPLPRSPPSSTAPGTSPNSSAGWSPPPRSSSRHSTKTLRQPPATATRTFDACALTTLRSATSW